MRIMNYVKVKGGRGVRKRELQIKREIMVLLELALERT